MGSSALCRLVMVGFGLAAIALVGCAAEDPQQVAVVDSSNQPTGASFGSGTDEPNSVDSENARSFAPIEAQPAPTPPPAPPIPPPSSEPPLLEPTGPPGLPTPVGAQSALPLPPPPPSFGGVNECDVVFPSPAIIVWGVDGANPDNGLWIHEGPSYDSPQIRMLAENAQTQFMTAGCRVAVDGTPWFEFGSSIGQLGYADSTYLRFSQLACLVGMVEARDPAGTISTIWHGPVEGHAYSDGGELAAFIPNDQLGSGQTYRLVPTASVLLVESPGRAICDLSDRQPELEASRVSRVDRPPYRGDCATGPTTQFAPAMFVDIDGVAPIDAILLTDAQPIGNELFTTLTVVIGVEGAGRCSWHDVANLYSGPLTRDDGGTAEYQWSCVMNEGGQFVQFVQYAFDTDAAGATAVTMLVWVDGQMQIESSGTVTETIDRNQTASTCDVSP